MKIMNTMRMMRTNFLAELNNSKKNNLLPLNKCLTPPVNFCIAQETSGMASGALFEIENVRNINSRECEKYHREIIPFVSDASTGGLANFQHSLLSS